MSPFILWWRNAKRVYKTMDKNQPTSQSAKNRQLGIKLTVVAAGMLGFSYLLVPLYDIICDITGLNGRTGVVAEATANEQTADVDRLVAVEFLAHTTSDGLWRFEPEMAGMQVHPGKSYTMNYIAVNLQDDDAVAKAVPSVAPVKAAAHFNKIECFCFTSQAFAPGERRAMPVTFRVNKTLPGQVKIISLAYTFYDITDKQKGQNHG